jgi:hypothetical protein
MSRVRARDTRDTVAVAVGVGMGMGVYLTVICG